MSEKLKWEIEEKKIPKARRAIGVRVSEYDDLVKAISAKPEGTTGEVTFSGKPIASVYAGLVSRKKTVEDTTPFIVMVREAERGKKGKLLSGRLFFKRLGVEEYKKRKRKK